MILPASAIMYANGSTDSSDSSSDSGSSDSGNGGSSSDSGNGGSSSDNGSTDSGNGGSSSDSGSTSGNAGLSTTFSQGTNTSKYAFQMELKQPKGSLSGLGSDMYKVKEIKTNVTDLIGSEVADSLLFPVSISENQVFFSFDLKVPEEPDSKKTVLENSNFFMSVKSIEEKEKRTKTYELEPQEYSNAIIGGHKVIDGYADLKGNKGTVLLNLEP